MKRINPYISKERMSKYILNSLLPILFNGIIIGMLVGVVVWGYNFCAEHIVEFSSHIYKSVHENLVFMPLLLLGVGLIACLMALLLKFITELAGSGIPYTEGVMRGQLKFKKVKMFFGTIIYSFITFFAGLPLGSEGPSVQLGGLVGNNVNAVEEKIRWRSKAWNRLSITSGASAGLAVAFNAPLTGLIFALEEGHKKFSPTILLSTASTVIFALLTSRLLNYVCHIKDSFNYFIFDFGNIEVLPYNSLWLLIILGLGIGIVAALFSLLLHYIRVFYAKFKIKPIVKLLIAFLSVGIIGVFFTDVLGGGSSLIKKLVMFDENGAFVLGAGSVALLLLFKVVLISLSSSSGTTGGLFIPLLTIGALVGGLFGHLFISLGVMEEQYYTMFIVIAMASMMAAVVRAPLTGIILVSEITGQLLNGFLQTAIVVVIAYFVVQLLNITPLYDELLDGTLDALHEGKTKKRLIIEEKIDEGSFVVGRSIRDILWPAGVYIVSVARMKRDGQVAYSNDDKEGERLIHAGDVYMMKADTYDIDATLDELRALTSVEKRIDDDKVTIVDNGDKKIKESLEKND